MNTHSAWYRWLAVPALAGLVSLAACSDRSSGPFQPENASSVPSPSFGAIPVGGGGFVNTVDLLAGQTTDVGDVTLTDDGGELTVEIAMEGEYCLAELHIHVAQSVDGIPQTPTGNPIPGQFDLNEEDLACLYEVTRTFDVSGFEGQIYVAVHTVVSEDTRILLATENIHPGADQTKMEARIYGISPASLGESLLDDQPESVNANTDNFNGNAFNAATGDFYFSRFDRITANEPLPSELFRNDLDGTQSSAGALEAGVAGGTFHDGDYYYVGQRTSELRVVTFDGSGDVDTETVLNANILAGTVHDGSVLGFGDLTFGNGKIYYAATVITGGFPGVLMTTALDGSGADIIVDGSGELGAGGIQIAFGGDGKLYGVNARTPFGLFEIDPATGAVSDLGDLDHSYSDLASGIFPFQDETAWGEGTRFTQRGNWGMYITYDLDCEEEGTLFGIDRGTGSAGDRIFRINPLTGSAEFVFDTDLSSSDQDYPNGVAYHEGDDRLYYSQDNTLYYYDFDAGTQTSVGSLSGTVAGATISGDSYWYVPNGTDDLYRADLDGGGLQNLVQSNFSGADSKSFGFGDLIVVGDVIYGSSTGGSGHTFFAVETDGSNYANLCEGQPDPGNAGDCPGGLQLAVGAGGTVTGHEANSGVFYEIDLATQTTTAIGTVDSDSESGLTFTDLASGPQQCELVESAAQVENDGGFPGRGRGR